MFSRRVVLAGLVLAGFVLCLLSVDVHAKERLSAVNQKGGDGSAKAAPAKKAKAAGNQNEKMPAGKWVDVYSTSFVKTLADLQGWKCEKGGKAGKCKTNGCSAIGNLLGGDNVFKKGSTAGYKVDGLVQHNKIRVQFDIVQFGSWASSSAEATVDGNKLWSLGTSIQAGNSICSTVKEAKERVTKVVMETDHTNSSAELSVYGDINANDSSWGISNVKVSVYQPPESKIGGLCNSGIKCKQGNTPVMCLEGRCVEQCVSKDDPRKEHMCLWKDGKVPLGRACQASSNCLSQTCRASKCVDKCTAIHCQNGSTCSEGRCKCKEGFSGTYCQIKPDPCRGVICNNGGSCVFGKCACVKGFTGDKCELAPIPRDSPGMKNLQDELAKMMANMDNQKKMFESKMTNMSKQVHHVDGALNSQIAKRTTEFLIQKLDDYKATYERDLEILKVKATLLKQSIESVRRLMVNVKAGAVREEKLTLAVKTRRNAKGNDETVKSEEKAVDDAVKEALKKEQQKSSFPSQAVKNTLKNNKEQPAPPPHVSKWKPVIPAEAVQHDDTAGTGEVKRDTKKIYNEIVTKGVPVVNSQKLLGGINVIADHDKTMTKVHGLTTDVEYLRH